MARKTDVLTGGIEVWNVCTNSALKRASRQMGKLYEDILAPSGLRITQFTLLSQILHDGDATMRGLADRLVMDLSAFSHTLKPLIRDGLVVLVADDRDRRVKRVQLTPHGIQVQADAAALWVEAQARFEAAFGKDRSDALRDALNLISTEDFVQAFHAAPE